MRPLHAPRGVIGAPMAVDAVLIIYCDASVRVPTVIVLMHPSAQSRAALANVKTPDLSSLN
jgi:hypothetical protein